MTDYRNPYQNENNQPAPQQDLQPMPQQVPQQQVQQPQPFVPQQSPQAQQPIPQQPIPTQNPQPQMPLAQQPGPQQPIPPQVPQPQRPQNPAAQGVYPRTGLTPPPQPMPPRQPTPEPRPEIQASEIVALMLAIVAACSLFGQYVYVRLLGLVLGVVASVIVLLRRNKLTGISIAALVIGIGAAGLALIFIINHLVALGLYT